MKRLVRYLPFVIVLVVPMLFYPGAAASTWRSSSDVYAVLEFASSLLAITAGIMVLLHFLGTGRRFFLSISIGLVLIGAGEFVSALYSFQRISLIEPSTFKLAISTTWLAGNLALAISLLIALALGDSEVAPSKRILRAAVTNAAAFAAAMFLTWLVFVSPFPPSFVQLGSTPKKLIELSLALLFFVASVLYANLYVKRQSRSPLLWSIVAFVVFRVAVHLLVFDARAFYDAHWDIAHVVALLSYLFPIFGVWAETVQLQNSAHAQLVVLEKEVTERKRVEEKLRESEQKYRALFENMAAGSCLDEVVYVDGKPVDYRILDINPAFEKIIGVTREQTMGKLASALYGDEIPFFSTYARVAETGEPASFEAYFPPIKRYLAVTSSCPGKGMFSNVFSDITERKQTEEKLRMSEFDLRMAQALAHVGSWRWDIAHDELIWSDEMYRIYGIARPAFTGSWQDAIARVVHPDDRARVEEANRAVIEDHNPQPLEYRIVRPDGSVRTVLDETGEMTLDDKGNVSSLRGVVFDITERKQLEAQLRQSQKMEAVGTLAGGVAHDFNNLLTGILGNIALMRTSLSPSDPLLDNLNAAETAARRAADLTKGLLTFSRSAMVLQVPTNITAALDASLALLKQSLPATMDIVHDYEQTTWNVLLDQSQMTQILLNLAVNARDAMDGKGTLTIRARNEVVEEDYVQTHPFAHTGEFVHLSVTDTGPGISPEVMQHIFEPFYTTKPVGSGTGLGLSIVYGAVKQADGWVTVASTEGVGATFDIYLPRCLEEPMESFAPSPLPVNAGSGTVLVVEDEPVVCAVAQALLSRSGYTVLTAPDGASALNALREHPTNIDLILLDMTMPGMTTGEIVQAIRALDPTVPILLNSGYTSNDTVKQMLAEHSVQGFLGKPYPLGELLDNVQRLLHRG